MSINDYEIGTLATFPEFAEQTDSLIEKAFGYQNGHHFAADFAPLAGTHNFQNRHILFEINSHKVVGHIGCHPRAFCWNGEVIPVLLIGGIAIAETAQGQGLFKEMFLRVLAQYHSQCAFFLLWSDKHELYSKYDFYLAGRQWCYRAAGFEAHGDKVTLKDLSPSVLQEMQKLYQQTVNQSTFSPLRDGDDWKHLKAVTSSELRLLKEKDKLKGYYFRNKGMDLSGIVHDWAHVDGVAGLLRDAGAPGVIWAAENIVVDDEVMQDLQQVGLWRANTHPMALKKLSVLLDGAQVDWADPYFTVKSERGHFRLKAIDLLEEVFGHGKHGLRKSVLPVWVGGLDSI